jgi:hypothetical protein
MKPGEELQEFRSCRIGGRVFSSKNPEPVAVPVKLLESVLGLICEICVYPFSWVFGVKRRAYVH